MVTSAASQKLKQLATKFPVVGLLGPRQSGKTTFAKVKRKSEAEFYISIHTREVKEKEGYLAKLESDWSPIKNIDLEKAMIILSGQPIEDRKLAGEMLLAEFSRLKKQGGRTDSEMAELANFKLIYDGVQSKVYVVSHLT